MGGDNGPDEVVAGALEAASDTVVPVLYGPRGLDTQGLELVEAAETIEMHEKPVEAVRAKPQSSLVLACRAVGEGDADAVVSAGNTGATLAAGLFHIRRLPEVDRPAIAVVIPARDGPSVLLDSGANADARAEHLLQFAQMGSIFAHEMLEIANPEVRLLSIGEEPEKGNQLTLEAHALLAASDLNFGGNVESRHLLRKAGDVVVVRWVHRQRLPQAPRRHDHDASSKASATRSARRPAGKVGGLLIRPAARHLRERLDPDTYGGAYLLGLRGLAVIAHGSSSPTAIANAIRLAARGVEHRVVERLAERLRGDRVSIGAARNRDPTISEVKWPLRARKCTSV